MGSSGRPTSSASFVRTAVSWRIAVGVGVGVALAVAGLGPAAAAFGGLAVFLALLAPALPRRRERSPELDPFTVGEPWRRFVQGAQRAAARIHETVDGAPPGPLRDRLVSIVERLGHGLDEAYRVARRGDEIDDAVRRLDPTALRSRLDTLEDRRAAGGADASDEHLDAAIESVRDQLATTERLKEQSAEAARRLELTRTRLDELGARAAEVALGSGDTDDYAHDVDDLVIELEALRLAIEETNRP